MRRCGLHLLDDLLQLPVLSLQLPGLLFIVVVGGGAGLQRVLLLRLPLATGDEAPHLARRQKMEKIKEQINTKNNKKKLQSRQQTPSCCWSSFFFPRNIRKFSFEVS